MKLIVYLLIMSTRIVGANLYHPGVVFANRRIRRVFRS